MADEWVWLRHPDTGGVQYAPPESTQTWLDLGWEPCDPPTEPNPALAEHVPTAGPRKTKPVAVKDPEPQNEKEMN